MKGKLILWVVGLSVITTSSLAAKPLSKYIGLGTKEFIKSVGAPDEIYSQKDTRITKSAVVLYYKTGLYGVLYNNRILQMRADSTYRGSIMGVSMNTSMDRARVALGAPSNSTDTELIFKMTNKDFPINIRLIFKDDKLVDAYVYRADF